MVQIASSGAPVITDRFDDTLWTSSEPNFGAFAATRGSDQGDGYVYTYAATNNNLQVARVPVLYVGVAASVSGLIISAWHEN